MTAFALTQDCSGDGVEGCEQCGGAVSDVVVGDPFDVAEGSAGCAPALESGSSHPHTGPGLYPVGSDTTRQCPVPSRRRTGRWKAESDALGAAASRRRARSGERSISKDAFLPPARGNSNACRLSVWFAGFYGSTWPPFHRESNAGGRGAAPRAILSA